VGKPEGKRPILRLGFIWENKIMVDVQEVFCRKDKPD
jgi:hypothetical protein